VTHTEIDTNLILQLFSVGFQKCWI